MTIKKHSIEELSVQYQTHTERALLVRNLKGEDVWLPKSQIEIDSNLDEAIRGDWIEIQMPEWLATDKELL